MNCERVRQLWDEYRDGQLAAGDADARGLEEHLADCPQCEKLWRSESAWLAVLGDQTPVSTEAESRAFTASVLRRWARRNRPSVVGRIVRLTAAAALIAAMLSVAAEMARRGNEEVRAPAIAEADSSQAVLLAEINAPILAARQAFDSAADLLDTDRHVSRLVGLLDTAVPPAPSNSRMQ